MTPIPRLTRAALWCALIAPVAAQADIYKCVDASGSITYTNAKGSARGCTLLTRDLPAAESRSSRSDSASRNRDSSASLGFPKVDTGTQQVRDAGRRSILERELATEEKLLEQARQEALRTYANAPGSALSSDKVQLHERNIQALKKEISKVK